MEYLYVLKLVQGKWYIGKTKNVERRFYQHLSGEGSKWTQLYKPIKLITTYPIKTQKDEDDATLFYMRKYGVDNVRGGSYCQTDISNAPYFLQNNLINLGLVESETETELETESETESGCYRCGRDGHCKEDCYARKHKNGYYL